jgi:ABC-type Fe3+/spermidine/putrescine transport system ATPase subunit
MSTTTVSQPASASAANAVGAGAVDAPAVCLSNLTKRYGDVLALDDVSLTVSTGEFLSILGPSGSGKTTTMRMIGGFELPDTGVVEIAGRDVGHLPPYRRAVNTVFQSYALFPHMNVEDNVAYGLKMSGVGKKERRVRAGEMLELVQLGHARHRKPGQLSGGMKQRVALARALINQPAVLLLDEPLGALDRKLREDMQIELRRIQTTVGITFVYVTHDQEEALSMSDRIVVMRHGAVEQIGAPAQVYDEPETLWVADFVGSSSQLQGKLALQGTDIVVQTDVAQVHAGYMSPDLASGDRVVAIVRPESVHVSVSGEPVDNPNQLQVTVEEILNMGPQAKIVARTAGGIEFVARGPRATMSASIVPGVEVTMHFPTEAVRVYAADPEVGTEATMIAAAA